MPRLKSLATVLSSLALLGMIIPPGLTFAIDSNAPESNQRAPDSVAIRQDRAEQEPILDIALAPGGILRGQLTDSAGQPQVEARVILTQKNQTVVETRTNDSGSFRIQNLRGGVYQIHDGSGTQPVRLWAPGSAPPSASEGVLVIVGDEFQRGQFASDRFPFGTVQPSRRAVILGSLIGAAIFVPLYTGRDRNSGS